MIDIARATGIVLAMLCVPTFAAGPGVADQGASNQSVTSDRSPVVADNLGADVDRRPAVATGSAHLAAPAAALRRQGGSPPRRRDRLWNGVLIGAGVGAMAGAFGGHALLDCSTCSAGFNVPLTFGLVGAGAGAAIGAGIDALRHTGSPIPIAPGPVTVTPVFGRGQRAVVALVRF